MNAKEEFKEIKRGKQPLTSTILEKVISKEEVGRTYRTTYLHNYLLLLPTLTTLDIKIIAAFLKLEFGWLRLFKGFFNAPVSSVQSALSKLEKKNIIEKTDCEATKVFKASLMLNGFVGIGYYQAERIRFYRLAEPELFEAIEAELDNALSVPEMQAVQGFRKKLEENKQTILAAERRKVAEKETARQRRSCHQCRKRLPESQGRNTVNFKGLPLTRPVWVCNSCITEFERWD